jgi:Ku C terminal domain like
MRKIHGNQVLPSLSVKLTLVFKEMETVIKNVVSKSFADSSYSKAIKALQVFRSEAIDVFPLF